MSSEVKSKAIAIVGLIISLMIMLVCLPIIVDQIQGLNTSSWSFTGHQGAVVLLQLLPFIFIAGMVVYFIGSILGKW